MGRATDPRGLVMLAFDGPTVPDDLRTRLAEAPAAGVTLFRHGNVRDPGQVRALTDELQAAAGAAGPGAARPGARTLLVAADQEGGQLVALGDETTQFAGAMALGAAGDPDLAERVGRATGLELRAMGVTVNYAPVCDLATNPGNPGLGIRSFGDDPAAAGALAAAYVRGLRSAGVAATVKHFPGKGEVGLDTHHALGAVASSRQRFEAVELAPFRAALADGADLVMTGHFAAPGLTGDASLPATLSRAVLTDLLRGELGFGGLVISDALDMGALAQDERQVVDVIAAARAGVDLLLPAQDLVARYRIEAALVHAAARGVLEPDALGRSAARLDALRRWLDGFARPDLDVVACAEHRALARELAERSITIVRDDAGLLPLRTELAPDFRIAVVQPRPRDVTPADTTSTQRPGLAAALRAHLAHVDEFVTDRPTDAEVAALRERAAGYDLLVVGTDSAPFDPEGAALARALVATGVPAVTVALRTPWDLPVYPAATTHVCSFGVLPPTLEAIAAALVGRIPFRGRLPVAEAAVTARTG
jgi:beta-N-acetylhexosaminidase